MADEIVPWDIEEIPDQDTLFMRIHQVWFSDGGLNTAVFRNTKGTNEMSTDWDKYSSARDTRRRSHRHSTEEYAIVAMNVGDVRDVPAQTVVHSPQPDNRSHTDVIGDKRLPEVRVKFGRLVERTGFLYRVGDPDE